MSHASYHRELDESPLCPTLAPRNGPQDRDRMLKKSVDDILASLPETVKRRTVENFSSDTFHISRIAGRHF